MGRESLAQGLLGIARLGGQSGWNRQEEKSDKSEFHLTRIVINRGKAGCDSIGALVVRQQTAIVPGVENGPQPLAWGAF